jgi:DNA-binding Lrp family transcriptional regulator
MKGELGTFSVAEILQLIGMQEKSGLLRVGSKGKSAVLFFEAGKVISARDRRQGARDPFLFYLQENGAIGLEELNQVLEAKQKEGGDTVDILLNQGVIDRSRLGDLLSEYARETLETMVKWETGTFEFTVSSDGLPEKAIAKPLRLEPILMEALRRKDEVEEIRRFLPSFDTTIKVVEQSIDDLHFETRDAAILTLVDGRRTIDEILEESAADEVETLDILERLFALGVISIAEAHQQQPIARIISPLRSVVIVAAVVLIGAFLRFTVMAPERSGTIPVIALRGGIQQFVDSREVDNVRFTLEAYRAVNGTYPLRLQELVSDGMLTERQIRNGRGEVYAYVYIPGTAEYHLSE